MKVTYQADNGKTFDNAADCLAYEKKKAVHLVVFDTLPTDNVIRQAMVDDTDGINATVANYILKHWDDLTAAVAKVQSV